MSDLPRSPSPGKGAAHYARGDLYRCDHGKNIKHSYECWDCCRKKAMQNKKAADEWLESLEARIEELDNEISWSEGSQTNSERPVYRERYTSIVEERKALRKLLENQPYRACKEAWKDYNRFYPHIKVTYCADKLSVRRVSDGKVFYLD